MLSMRYLIVSLAAVFLALGIGIFIGFMFDGQEIFLSQQETLLQQLEYKFGEIRAENEELKSQIELQKKQVMRYEDFNEKVFPSLVDSKLENINIAILETNEDYIYNGITTAIEEAKGNITSITYIKEGFLLKDPSKLDEVYSYFSDEKEINVEKNNFVSFLSGELSRAILENDQEIINYLKEKELIEIKGHYNTKIDYFVIAGGAGSKENQNVNIIDIPFIKNTKQYNIPIAGVELSNTKYSYTESYKKEKISTVDNVESMIGQYSLVEVIHGKEGNFGIKPSATGLIPQQKER